MKPTWIFTVATVNPTILEMTFSPSKHNLLKSWRRSLSQKIIWIAWTCQTSLPISSVKDQASETEVKIL
ncbi:hypothetical protein ACFX11_034793 [Malus domestica]